MACPSRKNSMVCRMIKDRERKPKPKETETKELTEEEHQERLQKLKDMGLLK